MSEKEDSAERLTPRDEDLSPGVKAFEAELASLLPRTDRLDRDELLFRAGEISGAAKAVRASRRRSVAWPGALAAMTTVAASLLVMLLVRPEPPIIERIRVVEAPAVERSLRDGQLSRPEAQDAEPPPAATAVLALPGSSSLPYGIADPLRARAVYLERYERMLSSGADPRAESARGPVEAAELPEPVLPYRQRLKTLLNDQARAAVPDDWPDTLNPSGANS